MNIIAPEAGTFFEGSVHVVECELVSRLTDLTGEYDPSARARLDAMKNARELFRTHGRYEDTKDRPCKRLQLLVSAFSVAILSSFVFLYQCRSRMAARSCPLGGAWERERLKI